MKRHCPRCGKPAAIVVTTQHHATRIGEVAEEEWRCEDCFKHFKLHSPKWDAFWLLFAVIMFALGTATALGFKVEPDQRVPVTVLLFAMAAGAGAYAAVTLRTRKLARPVSGE